ncbi:hypothetical protein [Nonomuraea sp. NPDC049784]|uniref:hypothetical protein n=1 Tax=Nonomuraea sp. NPDC049784 TaxID=3154361 RepID=UPI0033DE07FF
MSTSISPATHLDRAFDGMLAAVYDLVPPADVPDFSHVRLGLAQLKEELGLPLTERDYRAKIDAAAKYGRFSDELGPVWQQLPDVAQAVSNLGQHAPVIGAQPAAQRIRRIFDSARTVGLSVEKSLGKHYAKIASQPRVQAFFDAVRTWATRQMASALRTVHDNLDRAAVAGERGHQARHGIERLHQQLEATLQRQDRGHESARAEAARLRTSTTPTPPTPLRKAPNQPQRPNQRHSRTSQHASPPKMKMASP